VRRSTRKIKEQHLAFDRYLHSSPRAGWMRVVRLYIQVSWTSTQLESCIQRDVECCSYVIPRTNEVMHWGQVRSDPEGAEEGRLYVCGPGPEDEAMSNEKF
jgi:hypothetical protein